MAGGLSTPRPAAELQGGQGKDVLNGKIAVQTVDGIELSEAFIKGAHAALGLAQEHGIKLALLKSNSPSCGNEHIYNGRFNGTLKRGEGVTAALLRRRGVSVFSEHQLDGLKRALIALEKIS